MAEYSRISQRRCVQYIPMHLQEEPQGEVYINPIRPRGGTLCPPCHVFAYISANMHTSALKKLDFSHL